MFCDVTLTTNQPVDNPQSVECHKLILLSSSPYFNSLLNPKDGQVNIIDVSPASINVIKEIVAFLYSGQCLLHNSTVAETLETSMKWKLPLFTAECFKYMMRFKNIEYACLFYELSLKYKNIDAIYDLSKYIREHFRQLYEEKQLTRLSLKAFCEIISSDEVNVDTEDIVFTCAMRLIEGGGSEEDVGRCLQLIRYEHLTSELLFDIPFDQPIMKDEPQKSYLRAAHQYQCRKTFHPQKIARFWGICGRFIFVSSDLMICEIMHNRFLTCLMEAPCWIDSGTSTCTQGSTILFVSSMHPKHRKNMALVSLSEPCYVKTLPSLPEDDQVVGIANTGTHIYVLQAVHRQDYSCIKGLKRLCLMTNSWDTCPLMPAPIIAYPVTVQHNEYLYVIGSRMVQKFNLETSEWTEAAELQCHTNSVLGAVIYKERIAIVGSGELMISDPESNTLTLQKYNDMEDGGSPFVVNGELRICMERNNRHVSVRYDEERKKWNVVNRNIPDMLGTKFGMML